MIALKETKDIKPTFYLHKYYFTNLEEKLTSIRILKDLFLTEVRRKTREPQYYVIEQCLLTSTWIFKSLDILAMKLSKKKKRVKAIIHC